MKYRFFVSCLVFAIAGQAEAACKIVVENRSAHDLLLMIKDVLSNNSLLPTVEKIPGKTDGEFIIPSGCGKDLVFEYEIGGSSGKSVEHPVNMTGDPIYQLP